MPNTCHRRQPGEHELPLLLVTRSTACVRGRRLSGLMFDVGASLTDLRTSTSRHGRTSRPPLAQQDPSTPAFRHRAHAIAMKSDEKKSQMAAATALRQPLPTIIMRDRHAARQGQAASACEEAALLGHHEQRGHHDLIVETKRGAAAAALFCQTRRYSPRCLPPARGVRPIAKRAPDLILLDVILRAWTDTKWPAPQGQTRHLDIPISWSGRRPHARLADSTRGRIKPPEPVTAPIVAAGAQSSFA